MTMSCIINVHNYVPVCMDRTLSKLWYYVYVQSWMVDVVDVDDVVT